MRPLDKDLATFLGHCILEYRDTKFEFHPVEKLKIGAIECTGEAVRGRLSIATGSDPGRWLPVFVHEVCHLDQRRENPVWFDEVDQLVGKLDQWLSSKYSPSLSPSEMAAIVNLEHDCERRTMEKIKIFDLPIDLEEYAKKANAYLESYYVTFTTRKWDSAPYTNPERWQPQPPLIQPLVNFTQKFLTTHNLGGW